MGQRGRSLQPGRAASRGCGARTPASTRPSPRLRRSPTAPLRTLHPVTTPLQAPGSKSGNEEANLDETKFDAFMGNDAGVFATGAWRREERVRGWREAGAYAAGPVGAALHTVWARPVPHGMHG